MNPKYQKQYEEWHNEVSDSNNSLGGAWSPFTMSSYTPRLIEWLCSVFPIKNVVDIGCGTGEALRSFRKYGCQVLGIEGLKAACKQTDVITINHDFEKGPVITYNTDLLFSIEFVEHLNPDYIQHLIDTFTCAKMIVMSAAQENQPGHHHVNCRKEIYWQNLFIQNGYRYLKELSELTRVMDNSYYSATGMIFLKNDIDWGTFIGNYKEVSEIIVEKEEKKEQI